MKIGRWIAAAVAPLLVLCAAGAEPLSLSAAPVPLHAENDGIDRTGALRYLGGLRLKSPDAAFGGLSGLDISADGTTIDFVSDVGYWVRARLRYGPGGRLAGIDRAEIGRLLAPDGAPVAGRKGEADAESLAPLDGGIAVTFERDHRIWLYRGGTNPFLSRPVRVVTPRELNGAPPNKGAEAFAVLRDGRPIVIAENYPRDAPSTRGWIRTGDRWSRFEYERTGLFQPTGAAVLPDGDLLVLERRFTYIGGVASRLARVSGADLKPGRVIGSIELARLEPPLLVENFEGIGVRRDSAGRTLIYLVSDDNFNVLQRTLLLLFALEPG
jgi:hypothetical protein